VHSAVLHGVEGQGNVPTAGLGGIADQGNLHSAALNGFEDQGNVHAAGLDGIADQGKVHSAALHGFEFLHEQVERWGGRRLKNLGERQSKFFGFPVELYVELYAKKSKVFLRGFVTNASNHTNAAFDKFFLNVF
jgi:hypothetical protein